MTNETVRASIVIVKEDASIFPQNGGGIRHSDKEDVATD